MRGSRRVRWEDPGGQSSCTCPSPLVVYEMLFGVGRRTLCSFSWGHPSHKVWLVLIFWSYDTRILKQRKYLESVDPTMVPLVPMPSPTMTHSLSRYFWKSLVLEHLFLIPRSRISHQGLVTGPRSIYTRVRDRWCCWRLVSPRAAICQHYTLLQHTFHL